MNRSKKILWDEVKRLYTEEKLTPRDILDELQTRQYFDPKIIPSPQCIYDYLFHCGLTKSRKNEKEQDLDRQKQLKDLKARLKKHKFEKAKQLILDGLNSGDLCIDDLTRENIGRLQALIKDLTDKIGNAKDDKDKFESVKILDKVIQTLLKARILEDKPTEKTEGTVTLQDKLLSRYDKPDEVKDEPGRE